MIGDMLHPPNQTAAEMLQNAWGNHPAATAARQDLSMCLLGPGMFMEQATTHAFAAQHYDPTKYPSWVLDAKQKLNVTLTEWENA